MIKKIQLTFNIIMISLLSILLFLAQPVILTDDNNSHAVGGNNPEQYYVILNDYNITDDYVLEITGNINTYNLEIDELDLLLNVDDSTINNQFNFIYDGEFNYSFNASYDLKDLITKTKNNLDAIFSFKVNGDVVPITNIYINQMMTTFNIKKQNYVINFYEPNKKGHLGFDIITNNIGAYKTQIDTSKKEFQIKVPNPDTLKVDNNKSLITRFYTYGETLKLTAYDLGQLLTDEEIEVVDYNNSQVVYSFKNSPNIDIGLKLYNLKSGKYILRVKSSQNTLYAHNDISPKREVFYSVTRNNINKRVIFDVDNTNLFTITVEDKKHNELPRDVYDIYLKSGHGGSSYFNGDSRGTYYCETFKKTDKQSQCLGLEWEADWNLKVNNYLKNRFEQHGLKVLVSRTNVLEDIDIYANDGLIEKVYRYQPKYLLSNHHNGGQPSQSGLEIYTSIKSSAKWANLIKDNALQNGIENYNSDRLIMQRAGSESKKSFWYNLDFYYNIRDTGGPATRAGVSSLLSSNPFIKQQLESFQSFNYGAESILMEYAYMTNNKDFEFYKDNYQLYAEALVKATCEYLEIDYIQP